LTLEHDPFWLDRYRQRMGSSLHEFRLVSDWDEELDRLAGDHFGLVLVDQSPNAARAETVRRLDAEFFVIHDSEEMARKAILGRMIRDAENGDPGERDFSEELVHWKEFEPPRPWPSPHGPMTLLGSNKRSCDIEIDYASFMPSPLRRARTRGEWVARRRLRPVRRVVGRLLPR
jgi:hypothetical protein